jgi:predicted membrane protein (TIGR00267 family)
MVSIVPFLFLSVGTASVVAVVLTVCTLYGIGFVKGKATGTNAVRSGLEMMLVAGAATLLGFLIGKGAGAVFGLDLR